MTGNVLSETGDPAGARAAYAKALAFRQELADANPSDRDLAAKPGGGPQQHRSSSSPGRATRRGPFRPTARRWPIQQKLADANPAVTEFQLDLSWTQMSIGIVLSEIGDPVGARAAYDKALAIRQRLVDDNPTVTMFQDELANGYTNLGSLLSRTGDADGARAAYGKAIAIRQKLADANPGVIQYPARTGEKPQLPRQPAGRDG